MRRFEGRPLSLDRDRFLGLSDETLAAGFGAVSIFDGKRSGVCVVGLGPTDLVRVSEEYAGGGRSGRWRLPRRLWSRFIGEAFSIRSAVT